ncbi:MAG: NHS family xanthosine MFS transporter [Crocinitomicaceae bacterium]|jgi:NHS family xanthosine MFS transporter
MGIKFRLTVLNFLEFFAWGAWLLSAGSYMYVSLNFSGIQIGAAYATMGFASVFMPALMGIVADKWISAEKILGASHLILSGLLIALANATDFNSFYPLIFLVSMFFMPTIGLNRSISFGTLESRQMDIVKVFPPIRVWGTVGFILAAWLVDYLEFGITPNQFYVSAGASFILGVYAFTLPRVGIQESSEKKTFVESLGLDAFALFKKKKIAIFLIFSMLLGCVLQISNMWGDGFLQDFRGEYPDSFVVKHSLVFISFSMVSEALFILSIPFFLKKFGIKKVMLLSMLAWVLRFAFFGIGDPGNGFIFLTLSMIIYGMAFDFFNISGSMFMSKESSPSIRSSAQGLFMLMTNGLGAIIGAYGSGYIVDLYTGADGMKDWSTIWYIFALYALVVTIAFALIFKYKHDPEELGAVKH